MLRLVLDPENRTSPPTELDTREVSLQISFASSDLSKSGSAKAAHSLAFKLPFSDINDVALGYMNLLDVTQETRVERRCDVYDEDTLVLEGNLQVRSADLQARVYDCVIYGLEAGVWQTLKKSKWVDVFTYGGQVTTLLDHNHDAPAIKKSNLTNNNDVTDGGVGDNIIHYPLQYPPASSSEYQGDVQLALPSPLWLGQQYPTNSRMSARDYLPAMQMQYLLQQVFLHCGYTLNTTQGAFASGNVDWEKTYQTFARENLTYRPYVSPRVSAYAAIGADSGTSYTGQNSASNPALKFLAFDVTVTGDSDADDFFGGSSQFGGFTPPGPGVYNMRLELAFNVTGSSFVETLQLGVITFNFLSGQYGYSAAQYISVDDTSLVLDFQYSVVGFDGVYLPVLLFSIPTGRTLTFDLANCHLSMQSYIGDSPKLSIPNCFPDETVDKWLGAVMQQFNLLLTLDNEDKTAILHQRQDYFVDDVDEAKDWSTRLDRGQSMVVRNNLDRLYRQVLFTDKENDDYLSKRYQDNQGKGFTDYIYDSGLSLAQPSEEVGGYWSALRYTPPTNLTITGTPFTELPRGIVGFDAKENPTNTDSAKYALNKTFGLYFKPGPHVSWDNDDIYVGIDGSNGYNIYNSRNFFYDDTYETIKLWKVVQPFQANVTQFSWRLTTSYDQMGTLNTQSLFSYAYGREFRKKYSKEARTLECMMHLTPDDVRKFDYSDLIVVDGIYYTVDEIQNYVVGQRKPTKVKLNKLLDVNEVDAGTLVCSLFVDEIQDNGNVTFQDQAGVSQQASQVCCAFYGGGNWTFNASTNTCNTGQAVWSDADDFYAEMPSPPPPPLISDGAGSQSVEPNTEGNSFISNEHYKLMARTKSTTVRQAHSAGQTTQFVVPYDCIVGLKITYTAQVVSETNKGDLEFGELNATFNTSGTTITKTAADGEIFKNGNAGSTSIAVSVTNADGRPRFSVDCVGLASKDMEWAIDVEARVQRTPVTTGTIPVSISTQASQPVVTEATTMLQYQ